VEAAVVVVSEAVVISSVVVSVTVVSVAVVSVVSSVEAVVALTVTAVGSVGSTGGFWGCLVRAYTAEPAMTAAQTEDAAAVYWMRLSLPRAMAAPRRTFCVTSS
jgi:hypothetical protein